MNAGSNRGPLNAHAEQMAGKYCSIRLSRSPGAHSRGRGGSSSLGFELIKHDFSTEDLFGRFGSKMGAAVTDRGWSFYDRSRTTAEIVRDVYTAIREGAGERTVINRCNTIGHIGAGVFDLQRTGDDTSGRDWNRTRRMGVNTLAFRGVQHGAFFATDADCVGITAAVPWQLNQRWLDLLSRSGTPLFVSAAPEAVGAEQRRHFAKRSHARTRNVLWPSARLARNYDASPLALRWRSRHLRLVRFTW